MPSRSINKLPALTEERDAQASESLLSAARASVDLGADRKSMQGARPPHSAGSGSPPSPAAASPTGADSPTELLPPAAAPPSRWTAVLQVVAGHLLIFDTFGYIGSWGLFQSYYQTALSRSQSDIAWVGSIQLFLVFCIGTFSGRALDAGYLRSTIAAGCILQVIGIFATANCTQYWQLFLAQGVCVGLGNGLTFCPAISLISTYYGDRTRALAVSFAAAGASTGGMVFPAIAKQMLSTVGVAWTVRVMGFVFVANSAVALVLVRPRVMARKAGPLVEWAAFTELPYLLFSVGTFCALWGLYFAYYYVSIFGSQVIHVPSSESFYLIMTINGIGIAGRILPAWLATRTGDVLHVFVPSTFAAGMLLYAWAAVNSYAGLVTWLVFYGFFANAVQALFVGGVGSLTSDPRKMGTRIGMVFTIVSIACLTGPPIAGALIDLRHGDFLYAQIFGGTTIVCGGVALIGAIIAKKERKQALREK